MFPYNVPVNIMLKGGGGGWGGGGGVVEVRQTYVCGN